MRLIFEAIRATLKIQPWYHWVKHPLKFYKIYKIMKEMDWAR